MARLPTRRKRGRALGGGGNFLLDLLTLPVLGGPRLVRWVAKVLIEQAEQETLDEGALQGQLLELQLRYELDEMSEEEYARQEAALLGRLHLIRQTRSSEMRR